MTIGRRMNKEINLGNGMFCYASLFWSEPMDVPRDSMMLTTILSEYQDGFNHLIGDAPLSKAYRGLGTYQEGIVRHLQRVSRQAGLVLHRMQVTKIGDLDISWNGVMVRGGDQHVTNFIKDFDRASLKVVK